ncbi:MAG TPA: hypothetical protein VF339_07645 [Gammaproteobacteria bacterium]
MNQHSQSVGANVESERATVLLAYVLHLIGSVSAIPSLIGLLLNYLKRGDVDERLASHHGWMIRTFWWALLWVVVGWVTTILLVGWLILGLVWLWYVYRHVLGLIRLANGESMPR